MKTIKQIIDEKIAQKYFAEAFIYTAKYINSNWVWGWYPIEEVENDKHADFWHSDDITNEYEYYFV